MQSSSRSSIGSSSGSPRKKAVFGAYRAQDGEVDGTSLHRFAPRSRYSPQLLTTLAILLLNCYMLLQHRGNLSVLFYPSASGSLSTTGGGAGGAGCQFCIEQPDSYLCEAGLDNVRLSRSYEGSGYRVRKFLEKALRREAVRIGVIGASVSLGHGVSHLGYGTWHEIFAKEFKRMFPKSSVKKGLAGATGSLFYSYCFDTLIPRDLDLYIIELDINNPFYDETLDHDDALYRALLELPQKPAVIRVSVPALLFPEMVRGSGSGMTVSQHFDVPIISIRNILIPYFLKHPRNVTEHFTVYSDGLTDLRHISYLGHQLLGDMLTVYMKDQVCETKRRALNPPPPASHLWPQNDTLGVVPRLRVNSQYDETSHEPSVLSTCQFAGSESHPLQLLDTMPDGWAPFAWNDKHSYACHTPLKPITFKFHGVKVGLFIWVSAGNGQTEMPGVLGCWVDGNRKKMQVVDTYSQYMIPGSDMQDLFDGLERREHELTCMVLEKSSTTGYEVRITGLGAQ